MENEKIKLIEKINKDFEDGIEPKKLVEKYGISQHRLGSLSRLLGFKFSNATNKNLFDWNPVKKPRRQITLGNKGLGSPAVSEFKVLEHDTKNKRIVVVYK